MSSVLDFPPNLLADHPFFRRAGCTGFRRRQGYGGTSYGRRDACLHATSSFSRTRNPAEVIKQKTMQKLAQTDDLGRAQLDAAQGGPVADQEDPQELFEIWSQPVLLEVRLEAQFAEQSYFEGEQGLWLRRTG